MKNYDETINSVFSRIEEYNSLQKKKKLNVIRFTTALSCICLAVLVGIVIWKDKNSNVPEYTVDDALYPGIDDLIDDNTSANTNEPSSNTVSTNNVVINKLDSISNSTMDIALMWDDFVLMNETELNKYYGINVFPTVPTDLAKPDNQQYGIFKRDSGLGDIYHDVNDFNYSNEDYSRSVNVEMSKGQLPFSCVILEHNNIEQSIINGTKVYIATTFNDNFYVEFMYKNVGFRIVTEGLTEKELIDVISSIVK